MSIYSVSSKRRPDGAKRNPGSSKIATLTPDFACASSGLHLLNQTLKSSPLMPAPFSPETAARYILNAHDRRVRYENLPPDIAPTNMDEAYAAQEALAKLLVPREGLVAGLKIAVATKVMQELMGI